MAKFLVISVLLLFCCRVAAINCPQSWVGYAQNCYHFSHDMEEWIDARVVCQNLYNADLVVVNNAGEDTFLKHEIDLRRAPQYWIGANDLETEGQWVWVNPETSFSEYANWRQGEPNDKDLNENCVLIGTTYHGWNDFACKGTFNYICEKSATNGPDIIG